MLFLVVLGALWLSSGCLGEHVISKRQTQRGIVGVVSILSEPYLMRVRDEDGGWKEDEYEGYIPDLMKEVGDLLDVDCKIQLVKDGRYGGRLANGSWDGMVGVLVRGEADMAAAALTITSMRARVIDFTKPFMHSGLSTVVRKPSRSASPVFWLLRPFSIEVWVVVLVITAVCCVLMFVLNRFVPKPRDEETDSRTCGSECGKLFVALAKLMGVQSEQALSVSMFLVTWRTFLLFTGALYISTLISVVQYSPEVMVPPYTSFDELVKSSIPAGYIEGGSTANFFATSKLAVYARMYERIQNEDPPTTVMTRDEGIERAQMGNYAFIGESTSLDYEVQRHCNLMKIGSISSSVGYGLATPLGSDLREMLNVALLELRENGVVEKLYNKWWVVKGMCGKAPLFKPGSSSPRVRSISLGAFMDYGVVVLLVMGLVLTIIAAVVEKMQERKQQGKGKNPNAKKVNETVA